MILALIPNSLACLANGPPVAAIPPNKIISGFLALIFVRIALKSVALLLVAS